MMIPLHVALKEQQNITDMLQQRLLIQATAIAEQQAEIKRLTDRLNEVDPTFLNPDAVTDSVEVVPEA